MQKKNHLVPVHCGNFGVHDRLCARLWCLQYISNGDTAVLHTATDICMKAALLVEAMGAMPLSKLILIWHQNVFYRMIYNIDIIKISNFFIIY